MISDILDVVFASDFIGDNPGKARLYYRDEKGMVQEIGREVPKVHIPDGQWPIEVLNLDESERE